MLTPIRKLPSPADVTPIINSGANLTKLNMHRMLRFARNASVPTLAASTAFLSTSVAHSVRIEVFLAHIHRVEIPLFDLMLPYCIVFGRTGGR